MFIKYHTTNFDDTATRIKKLVAVLDKCWFIEIKKEFQAKCEDGDDYYDAGPTEEELEESFLKITDPEEQEFMRCQDYRQLVFFKSFYFIPGYSSNKDYGKIVADRILKTTSDIIAEAGVDYDYVRFISLLEDVKRWIDEEVNDNLNSYQDQEYKTAMTHIVHHIKWDIDHHFNNKVKALEYNYKKEKVGVTEQVPVTKKIKILYSYHWLGKPEEIRELYNKMKSHFISSDTKFSDFKNMLTKQDISMIHPIKFANLYVQHIL